MSEINIGKWQRKDSTLPPLGLCQPRERAQKACLCMNLGEVSTVLMPIKVTRDLISPLSCSLGAGTQAQYDTAPNPSVSPP